MQGDGPVRAVQIIGIEAHQTPALAGKAARWLFDLVLASSIGSGTREGRGRDRTAPDPNPNR